MKSLAIGALLCIFLVSCVTNVKLKSDESTASLNKDSYQILEEQKTKSRANKFWILFFPFGGKGAEKREAQCFNRMVVKNKADGVLAQKYVHRKFVVPLIVFTYVYKETELTGKPYIIKTK